MFFSFLQIYIFFSNRTKFTPYIYIITAFLPKYYTNKKKSSFFINIEHSSDKQSCPK